MESTTTDIKISISIDEDKLREVLDEYKTEQNPRFWHKDDAVVHVMDKYYTFMTFDVSME